MTIITRYCVNGPNVISESIDGESIIINLETGTYYSMEHSGAMVWDLIAAGASVKEIGEALARQCEEEQAIIDTALTRLIGDLVQEGLIRTDNGAARPSATTPEAPSQRGPFKAPVLHRYTDMQEFILLDPIHEADEAGWPAVDRAPSDK